MDQARGVEGVGVVSEYEVIRCDHSRAMLAYKDGAAVTDPIPEADARRFARSERLEAAARLLLDDCRDEGRADCRDSIDEMFVEQLRSALADCDKEARDG